MEQTIFAGRQLQPGEVHLNNKRIAQVVYRFSGGKDAEGNWLRGSGLMRWRAGEMNFEANRIYTLHEADGALFAPILVGSSRGVSGVGIEYEIVLATSGGTGAP